MPRTGNVPQSEIKIGQQFGLGVVTELGLRSGKRQLRSARLICHCGTSYVTYLGRLRAGLVQSCGCLRRETARRTPVMTASIHGLAGHPLYNTWRGILDRCENPACARYHDYGGRGIKVCERWHDVRLFIEDIERTIGPRPEGLTASGKRALYSLDRVRNEGNYELGNVRWVTWHVQRLNSRVRPQSTPRSAVELVSLSWPSWPSS